MTVNLIYQLIEEDRVQFKVMTNAVRMQNSKWRTDSTDGINRKVRRA